MDVHALQREVEQMITGSKFKMADRSDRTQNATLGPHVAPVKIRLPSAICSSVGKGQRLALLRFASERKCNRLTSQGCGVNKKNRGSMID